MKSKLVNAFAASALLVCASMMSTLAWGDVTCEVTRLNQWQSGYQAAVTVNNDGSAVTGWEVEVIFSSAPNISAGWNAGISENGNSVIASNISWNGSLSAGGSTSFGFTGNSNGSIQAMSCASTTAAPASSAAPSSSSSIVIPPSSSSSSEASQSSANPLSCIEMCKWYQDAPRPLCVNQVSGWGWEANQTCIGRSTCESQFGGGGVIESCTALSSTSSIPEPSSSSSESSIQSSEQSSSSSDVSSSSEESSSSSSSVFVGDSDLLARIDIFTDGGTIVDEPKIDTRMEVTEYDGNTPVVTYDGFAGIEFRGSSSQMFFDKKSYGLETRDAEGQDFSASILGFPEEEDWVLYAPYSDKTMMRNTLIYSLYNDAGRYASRWRYVDLYINNEYQGVYVFMEKMKRDKNRIDLAKLKSDEISGEDVTGGYILKLDKTTGGAQTQNPWGFGGINFSNFTDENSFQSLQGHLQNGGGHYFLYDYPDPEDIVAEQKSYIQQVLHDFEAALASSNFSDATQGYRAHVDVDSFIDYFLFTELSADVDAFTMSTYIVKDKNEKVAMGPLWDYNIAFGNANFCNGDRTDTWKYEGCAEMVGFPMPFWWARFLEDSSYTSQLKARWQELRSSVLSNQNVMGKMDEIRQTLEAADAINRNNAKWPVIGQNVWPNNFVGATYDEEINYMKNWLRERLSWMDANISSL